MSKITAIIRLPALPGKAGIVAEMVQQKLAYIRGKPANSGADAYVALDRPDAVTLIEVWENPEAHQRHVKEMTDEGIFGALSALMSGPPEVTYLSPMAR